MCILCIGIGVSFSLIYRLTDAHGVDCCDIFRRFKSHGVKQNFIYTTIRRYRETGSAKDRARSGRPRSARTPVAIEKPNRSIRKTAAGLDVPIGTTHTIMTKDLGYEPYG